LPIIKEIEDNREGIEFKNLITLSNGIIGKNITIDIKYNDEIYKIQTKYLITEDSRIFNIFTEKELKGYISKDTGYKVVNLQLGKAGEYKTQLIHRLVGKGFIPNPENLPVINHEDGDKLNNDISNLVWCTYSYNNYHAFRTGLKKPTSVSSEKCNLTTHTIEEATLVCELLSKGISPKKISNDYNLGYDFVLRIRKRETWKELSKNYKFKKTKKASAIFSYNELVKIENLFKQGFSVREVINEMGWEYDEKIRSNVKHLKSKFEKGKKFVEFE